MTRPTVDELKLRVYGHLGYGRFSSRPEPVEEVDNDAFDSGADCKICGCYLERESCWECLGEGGWHDCGEDCCPCYRPKNNVRCQTCNGTGEYDVCPNADLHEQPNP